jgi:hypothetical protein
LYNKQLSPAKVVVDVFWKNLSRDDDQDQFECVISLLCNCLLLYFTQHDLQW